MNSLKTVALSIMSLATFTNMYCALYYIKNEGTTPITVNIRVTSNELGDKLFNPGNKRILYAKDLQPNAQTQLNAGGGWEARSVGLLGIDLANSTEKSGPEKGWHYFPEYTSADYDITFNQPKIMFKDNRWEIKFARHKY